MNARRDKILREFLRNRSGDENGSIVSQINYNRTFLNEFSQCELCSRTHLTWLSEFVQKYRHFMVVVVVFEVAFRELYSKE